MRTAIVALTSYLFAQTDLLRIYAEPFASNLASIRALERAGYICEGRLHCSVVKEGKVLDQLLFAAVRTVYAAPGGR
jgi:RimJ/RimL family protein N-acetyltransferase